jgi:hypothetical protein
MTATISLPRRRPPHNPRRTSEVDHLGGPINEAVASVLALNEACVAPVIKGPRSVRVRLDLFKKDGSTWYVCRSTTWKYGRTGLGGHGDIRFPIGPLVRIDHGGASRCGPGIYGTMAYAYVRDGSTWRGGSVWSGSERMPYEQ